MYKFNITSYLTPTPRHPEMRLKKGVVELGTDKIHRNQNGKWCIELGLGYQSGWGNWCREDHTSAIPGNRYRIMNQWKPRKGDTLIDCKSGRKFTVGEVTGFVCYMAPLLENGIEVAILKFEDYYKD